MMMEDGGGGKPKPEEPKPNANMDLIKRSMETNARKQQQETRKAENQAVGGP